MDSSTIWDAVKAILSKENIFLLFGTWIIYRFCIALYNISPLHPLYKFPGPKLAAISFLYEAYYEWILVGRYGHEIARMHEIYGNTFSFSFSFFPFFLFFFPLLSL